MVAAFVQPRNSWETLGGAHDTAAAVSQGWHFERLRRTSTPFQPSLAPAPGSSSCSPAWLLSEGLLTRRLHVVASRVPGGGGIRPQALRMKGIEILHKLVKSVYIFRYVPRYGWPFLASTFVNEADPSARKHPLALEFR